MSVISQETMAHVQRVAAFFGIDLDANRHIFRAASSASGDAFATVMKAMALEIERDVRFGVSQRIRQEIAKKRRGEK